MSIDITIEEMEALPAESYELFDIRGEIERAHGILPNSTASSADVLMENPPEDKEKKIIICCSRGQISRDIAEELQEQGYEAYSLKGGYVGLCVRGHSFYKEKINEYRYYNRGNGSASCRILRAF